MSQSNPTINPQVFDEMGWPDGIRAPYALVEEWLSDLSAEHLALKRREAEVLFRRIGITFAVYTEGGDPERLIPFDFIPRIMAQAEWMRLRDGLEQRARALNAFIHDVYHEREIVRAGHIPERLVLHNSEFRPEMAGLDLPGEVYSHIAGIDLVRTGPDDYYVLEDNCRTPSGVSYMVENREAMQRLFPELFRRNRVAPVGHYPDELLATLRSLAPPHCTGEPTVVLLTPAPTTAPTTSTPSSPTKWALTWSKARIWWSARTFVTSAPPPASSAWT